MPAAQTVNTFGYPFLVDLSARVAGFEEETALVAGVGCHILIATMHLSAM